MPWVGNEPLPDSSLTACLGCDLLQRVPDLEPGGAAACPRCGEEVARRRIDSLDRTLALSLAAAVLFVVANSVPMLGIDAVGRHAATTVFGGARQLWEDGRQTVAVLVFCTAILAPALQIAFLLAISFAARRPDVPRWIGTLLRRHPVASTWSMIEVMLLGVLVSVIKIADYATVVPGVALFALGGLVVLFAAIQSVFDPQEVWRRVDWATP